MYLQSWIFERRDLVRVLSKRLRERSKMFRVRPIEKLCFLSFCNETHISVMYEWERYTIRLTKAWLHFISFRSSQLNACQFHWIHKRNLKTSWSWSNFDESHVDIHEIIEKTPELAWLMTDYPASPKWFLPTVIQILAHSIDLADACYVSGNAGQLDMW